MKIALVLAIYKRHDLEEIVLDNFRRQSKKFGFEIIVAGSEGQTSKRLAKGCHYIEAENDPLSDKHNELISKAKELDVDGLVLMGSDDIVNDAYWEWVYKQSKDEPKLLGLKDIYFYSTHSKELFYWPGYERRTQTVGAGRFFSRYILDQMNWKLWPSGLPKGLDRSCSHRLLHKGIKEQGVMMDEIGAFLVDVKHTKNITNVAITGNCKKVNTNIMTKKKIDKKTVEKTEKLENKVKATAPKKVYNAGDVVKFESNGKSKHLPKGKVYEIDGLKANLFLTRGFGKIIG